MANCIICDEQKLSYLKFSIVKYIICYEQKLFYLKFSMVKYIKCYEQKLCYLKFSMVKYIICYEQKLFYLKFSMVKYIICYEQKLSYLKFSMVKYIICYGYLINVGSVQEVVNRLKCFKGICAKDQFLGWLKYADKNFFKSLTENLLLKVQTALQLWHI